MLNDREDKYENQEDSEYHFSDDDVSYEIDTEEETAKTAQAVSEPKENFLSKLTRSKRMLISLAVFFVLIFIVYKMVTPTNQIPSTEISTPVVAEKTTTGQPAPSSMTATAPSAPTAPTSQSPAIATTTVPTTTTAAAPQVPSVPVVQQTPPAINAPQTMAVSGTPGIPPVQPVQQSVSPMVQQPYAQPEANNQIAQPGGNFSQQQMMVPPQQQAYAPQANVQVPQQQQVQQGYMRTEQQPLTQQQLQQQQMMQQPMMPQQQVMLPPAQSIEQPPRSLSSLPSGPPPQIYPSTPPVMGQTAETGMGLSATSSQMMAQVQAQYVQRLNDFANQNKNLQEKVTALNSRVVTMESALNQLIQVLTRQTRAASHAQAEPPPPPPPAVVQSRAAYNVQAIIPGRAWLRADNGETLTVTEGDMIKSLGRVSRIDPYDGVVEVNTGTKIISLSYGNGS